MYVMKRTILNFLNRNQSLDHSICECRDQLYRVALSWSGDSMLADDLVQDTMTTALRKKDSLRDVEKLPAWLYRILYRCWQQHLRNRKSHSEVHDNLTTGYDLTEHTGSQDEICKSVREAIYKLPGNQRHVVTLVDLQGLSYSDVSSILDVPIGTVMSRLSRARSTLAGHLQRFRDLPDNHSTKIRSVS